MQTPQACNQALRYRLRSHPVVPLIVTIRVLHGVQDVLFPRSCFLTRNRFLSLVKWLHDTLKITVGHRCTYADVSTRQVHTLQLQLQPQSFNTCQLTPMKCPHLLSHEMTGQVDSGALDQFLSSPHVVLYLVVVSCSAELCFVFGKDGLRYRLRTPCNSEHSGFIGQYSNKRTTYHSATELVSRHTSHTVHEEIGTTLNTGLSETSHVQFASKSTLHTSLANCFTSWMFMSCSTFNLKSCSQTGWICIFAESVTPSKQIVTSGTQVNNEIKEWAFSFC